MELFKLLGTIAIDNSGANTAIDDTTGRAEGAHSKITGAFGKIGSAAVTVGKTVATGLAASATAIGALTKTALDGYADYEQLVGGVETLFKDSGNKVLQYANKAYKTAGMSANAYMETVTAFSASLLQSLGGDTEAAAKKADQAIIDMSDNANKMGSSMESIQNAYQGFAKQNYTMLDNLKLGYGGTKGEMERLLKDATAISKIEYDISSYADVVDAIHVIQEEMGIAGTTAKEASSTISGSISTMKSAWSNLLTGLGSEDADLSGLIDQLIDSVMTVTDNVLPRIEVILGGITNAIAKIAPKIAEKLPSLLRSVLPSLLEGAVALLNGLVAALPGLVQIIIEQVPFIVQQIGAALKETLPQLLEVVKQLLGQIWDYVSLELLNTGVSFDEVFLVVSNAFSKLWETLQIVWETVGKPVFDAISGIISQIDIDWSAVSADFGTRTDTLFGALSDTWATVGKPVFDSFLSILNTISENWGVISNALQTYFRVLCSFWSTIWKNIGKPIWDMISFAIVEVANMFSENMPAIMGFFHTAVEGIADTWENHLKPIFEAIGTLLNKVVKPAFELVFAAYIKPLIENVFQRIANLWTGTLKPIFDGICDFLTGTFTGDWKKAFNGILSIVTGIFNAIVTTINSNIDRAKNIVSNGVNKLMELFNFDWKLPKIKLPHFKVSGSFSLNPPSAPSFGIDWYKKAMDDPMIMNSPTAFGVNSMGQIMAGGEAGSEVVSGTDTLMQMISEAVAAKNARLEEILLNILAFMMEYMPQMANMQLVTDTGVLIGELAPGIDDALGKLATRNGRGI